MQDQNPNKNWCFAEDTDIKAATIAVMRHHIPTWPHIADGAPVHIQVETKVEGLLKPQSLKAELQATGRRATGIILDAEQSVSSVWDRIKNFASGVFSHVPDQMPPDGLVLVDTSGRRFGVWIMPNNQSPGMLEDFLRTLVPDTEDLLWQHSVQSVTTARANAGARCREIHLPKAYLHTWLAFQDPPGERIGIAITKKILDPDMDSAKPFVNWFKQLYEL